MRRLLFRASAGAAGAAFALAAPSTTLLESRLKSTPTDSATNSVLEGQQTPREAFKRATPAKSAAAADFADAVAEEAASGRPIFVGIAGGTGSGKTTVAAAIAARVGPENLVHISHDSYYRDLRHLSADERARTNFDHPDSLETSLLVDHLRALRAGRSVDVPVYDFSAHARTDDTERKRPAKIVLVEGILIYSAPELRELLDIKIFVDTEADVRFIRRLRRDIVERARSYDSVVAQCAARAIRPQIRRNSAHLSLIASPSLQVPRDGAADARAVRRAVKGVGRRHHTDGPQLGRIGDGLRATAPGRRAVRRAARGERRGEVSTRVIARATVHHLDNYI